MRDPIRHPDPAALDLGLLCLQAVILDERMKREFREQARHLLELQTRPDLRPSPGLTPRARQS